MRNVLRLAAYDLCHLFRNVVTTIIVLGLVFLPSIFSWYNILACWDVFGNTGGLTVAVANADEGYESDLVPLPLNIGDQVISALRANDQLDWVFTDEQDAVDGTMAGRYYAAVVIPASFSSDLMSFFGEDVTQAHITYYTNVKKSAIAPKVTDQGADQVSAQVNQVFAETLSDIVLALAQAMLDYLDTADAQGALGSLGQHVQDAGEQFGQVADVLVLYAGMLGDADALVQGSAKLLAGAQDSAGQVGEQARSARSSALDASDAVEQAASGLADALSQSAEAFEGTRDEIDAAFDAADTCAEDAAASLEDLAQRCEELADEFDRMASQLAEQDEAVALAARALLEAYGIDAPEGLEGDLGALAGQLQGAARSQHDMADGLRDAARSVRAAEDGAKAHRAQADESAELASRRIEDARATFARDVQPVLDELAGAVSGAASDMQEGASLLSQASGGLQDKANDASGTLGASIGDLEQVAADLREASQKLTSVGAGVQEALESGDAQQLRAVIGSDPSQLASVIAAPVSLERHAVYPASTFGSAMSPLYTTLALWIGALLAMVAFKVTPSARARERLDRPTPTQLFCGRYAVLGIVSLAQSTVLAAGNLFFLGVDAAHPMLYMLCFWVAGLVFSFMIYTLVASFANLGKALGVMLLIVQVSGGGGSFPLALLPGFFQAMSPWLPITHAINAMRAAMFGIYANDFWVELGVLALMTLPFLLLGLLLRNPLIGIVEKFVARVERSKLI